MTPTDDQLPAWTRSFDEVKKFELALAQHFHSADRCRTIARLLGKPVSEIQQAYAMLEDDMRRFDAGDLFAFDDTMDASARKRARPNAMAMTHCLQPTIAAVAPSEQQQRKGVPWTTEEHRLFLLGLAKFGKGSWRSISRQFVHSRTPTQVASHAQKYFLRLNSTKDRKEKRRASIHDFTTDDLVGGDGSTLLHVTVPAH